MVTSLGSLLHGPSISVSRNLNELGSEGILHSQVRRAHREQVSNVCPPQMAVVSLI